MSRPLRTHIPNGWYHVINRGIDRNEIFRTDRDRSHFLELLAEATERFLLQVHAYVLMDNHYHLLAQTPETNLSAAMQWINQSYATWFNRKHQRVGPLYQGRFKDRPVESGSSVRKVALYIHLNPVRITELGLGKKQQAVKAAWENPDRDEVKKRLEKLRTFTWSSYRAYAGYADSPDWLTRSAIQSPGNNSDLVLQQKEYRRETRRWIAEGLAEDFSEKFRDALAIGSEKFLKQVLDKAGWNRESDFRSKRKRFHRWDEVVKEVSELSGLDEHEILSTRGHWSRGALFWAARHSCGMTLSEIGQSAGGKDYASVAMAIRRYEEKVRKHRDCKDMHAALAKVLNVKT